MRYEFSEVLNDLVDYFLVADIQLLERFKQDHDLPNDLARAFTSSDIGDQAVLEGVVLPLAGIENLPYRIIFSVGEPTPALLEPGNRVQHRRAGYVLRVENRAVMLFTWRILQHFTPKTLGDLLARYQEPGRPIIELENGWYDVEVLGGAVWRDGLFEPAFEFVLKKTWRKNDCAGVDVGYRFTLRD
ncbi:hypothetical protein ACQKPE_00680 [Pseudomonas sp. NPDC089554]|uniref:hypothetical protein n=1 Tax=Pseudomonas sp. NPDC089554 TaxID=3390653 RepID=UPI003D03FCA5